MTHPASTSGTALNPTRINGPESGIHGKAGREARNKAKFFEKMTSAKSSRMQMSHTHAYKRKNNEIGLATRVFMAAAVSVLASAASALSPENNNANYTFSIGPKADKGDQKGAQKSHHSGNTNDNQNHHFYSSINKFSKNKASRQSQSQAHIIATRELLPFANNTHNGKRLLPTGVPKKIRITVSKNFPKKIPYVGVKPEKNVEESVGTTKLSPEEDVRKKENISRHPLSLGRKSSQRLSTDQYLRNVDEVPIFLPHNATPTKLTIGERKSVHEMDLVKDTTSEQHAGTPPGQEKKQQYDHLASDFDLDNFPLLAQSTTGHQIDSQRIKRNIAVRFANFPQPSGTETDGRERHTQEEHDGILPGRLLPTIAATETTTQVIPFPVPINKSSEPKQPFHMRPLTDFFVYEAAFLLTLEKVLSCSREQAQQTYAKLNADMYQSWRNVMNVEEIEAVWVAQSMSDRVMAMTLHYIMDWLGEDAWDLYKEIDHVGAVNLGIAKYREQDTVDYFGHGEQLYWEMLDRRNLEMIDPRRIVQEGLFHLNIYKALCTELNVPVDTANFLDRKPGHTHNILIDQAALIDHTVDMINAKIVPASSTLTSSSYQDIQNKYVQGLLNDLQDKFIAQKIIPTTSFPLVYAKITYCAGAITGAVGLNAEGVARVLFESTYQTENPLVMEVLQQMPGVLADKFATELDTLRSQFADPLVPPSPERYTLRPDTVQIDDVWLTLPELTFIVKKTMLDWKLDIKFPIGSPHHSTMTINKREGPSHRVNFRDTTDLAQMVKDLISADARWFKDPQNPFTPSLLAALHRTTCLGIPLLDMSAGDTREQRTVKLVEQRFAPLFADEGLRLWLHNFLPSLDYFAPPSQMSGPDEILPFMSAIYKYFNDCMNASEFINYESESDLVNTLRKAFNDALNGYRKPPIYDWDTEIRRRLQRYLGMTEAETNTPRWVNVGLPGIYRRDVPFQISPLEEFKLKNRLEPYGITFNGRSINDVVTVSKKIEPAFRAQLYSDPVVRARVLESLRMSGIRFNQKNVDDLLDLSVTQIIGVSPESQLKFWYATLKGYFIGTSIRHLLIEGLSAEEAIKEVVELVPFLEGTIEIIEGIATLNGTEVMQGALSLGEDAVGVLVFGVFEGLVRKGLVKVADAAVWKSIFSKNALRMSSIDAAKVEMLKEASIHFPQFADDITFNKRKLIISDDSHNVKMHRFVDHSAFSERAALVRNGEKNIDFVTPTKEVLPLVDVGKGRVVPVRSGIFCMIQCDFSGNPIRDAKPVFRMDTTSTRMGVSEGVAGGSATLSDSEISERPSVKPLVVYLDKIKGRTGLNDWDSDFLSVFYSAFKFENPAHPEAREFIKNIEWSYKGSALMRSVLTNAIKNNKGKLIKVVFDAERARADGNTIYFINAQELKKIHYMTETGPKPITKLQMQLHEPMHLLTGLEDVPRALAREHRGPNVVISDEIQRQASSELIDQRLCYEKAFFDKLHGHANTVADQTKGIGKLVDYVSAEDSYLSGIFEDVAKPFGHPDVTMGILKPRVTILEMQKFNTLLDQNFGRGHWPIESMLRTQLDSMVAAAPTDQIRMLIADVRRPLMQNKPFNDMHLLWIETHHATPLKVTFAQLEQGGGPLEAFKIERGRAMTNMVINSNPVYFFNMHGPQLMSDKRKLFGAFVELYYPEDLVVIAPSYITNPYHDRTLRVMLENGLVMEETAAKRPLPRICKALTASADGWLPHRSGVTQMAKDEDRILRAMRGREVAAPRPKDKTRL